MTIDKRIAAGVANLALLAIPALAAASCSHEVTQNLPLSLLTGLEDGPYGRLYLAETDRRLRSLMPGGRLDHPSPNSPSAVGEFLP